MPGSSATRLLEEAFLVEAVHDIGNAPAKTHGLPAYPRRVHTGAVLSAWQDLAVIERLIHESRSVAVVGVSADPARPSHGVARYLARSGLTVYPVNPALTEWEGLAAYPSLADVPGEIDIVDVFRRPEHAPGVARDAVAAGAGALWLQLGVISEEAAELASAAGLDVVMDRCLAVEHREVTGWS